MTLGRYGKTTLAAMLVLCSLYAGFVLVFEYFSRLAAQKAIEQHARVISNNLWNYNSEGASEYLRLAAVSHHYERLVVTDYSGGVFQRNNNPVTNRLDRILIKLHLMPRVNLLAYVEHKENLIGWIEASWRPRTVYIHIYALAFLLLVLIIIHLYVRTLQAKEVLEDRVRERTSELVESNANLQNEIAERRRADEERTRLQEQLKQAHKMEAIGTLAGGIAHDFNNILQAISGYTQLMLLGKDKNDLDHPKLEAVREACHRAAQLVQQLLLFSRKVETESRPINLNREVDQARRILERTIPKMIGISVDLDENLRAVNADPVQMERILLNLGTNAADAMPEGGRLVFRTKNVVLDERFVQDHLGAAPGAFVLLTISDTGHGMDREVVEHIFEPFYSTKEVGKGTGLGLASVYGIVKSHNGYITCESRVGQGTSFKIYLPALLQEEDRAPEPAVSLQPRGGHEVILVVDDDDSIRDVTSQILGEFGYRVLKASSGEQALEIYFNGRDRVDMVVLDIGMPGMGGHRCLQELMRKDKNAKVLVASGYTVDRRLKQTLEKGAAGYVGKPYQAAELLDKVRAVLDG